MSSLFDPRLAANLQGLGGSRGLPAAPKGTKVQPQPNNQPMLPLQAPLAQAPPEQVANTPGGTIDVVHPGQTVGGQYKLGAYMQRQPFSTQFNTPTTPEALHAPLESLAKKALGVIKNPDKKYSSADQATKLLLIHPGPELSAVIQSDPELQAKHAVVLSKIAKDTGLGSGTVALPHPTQGALERENQRIVAAQAQNPTKTYLGTSPQDTQALEKIGKEQSLFPIGGNLPEKLATETGQTLMGLGPGLVKMGYGLATHPEREAEQMGGAIAHSYGETIHHPLRQLGSDPLGLVTNVATAPFAAAGGVARVAELGRAGELAEAAGTSTARQVGKTLIRPQPQERNISVGYGADSKPINFSPAAYKSAAGGYLQTKLLDPLLEHNIKSPNPYLHQLSQHLTNFIHAPSGLLSADARVGRKLRQEFEDEVRIRSGKYSAAGLEPGAAISRARGTAFADRWKQLYDAGATHDEALLQPWRDWVPIKRPPDGMKIKPQDFDTEGKLADKFGKGHIVPSDAEYEKDPTAYSHVPAELLRSMRTYAPGSGPANTVLNAVNRGTQIIRSGRFMTPAYAQWAVQNGLLHLSQAGPLAFRNAWQLRHEFPQASPVTQAAIDGGMGGGIARATSGGLKTGRITSRLQEVWHNLDDRWARRMSAIHELNAAGYHTAESWDKLVNESPTRFRKIVGGQANREAINYTEMTPAERSLFARLFTAYGWTRGASTYAARFPLQHPVQARVGIQAGQQGSADVNSYYEKLGGMAPNWLREYAPTGAAGRLLGTSWLNPAGTLGNLIGETPGATIGQTENILGEAAPIPAAGFELASGVNKYGTAYKGSQRLTAPLAEAAGRFKPLAVLKNFAGTKKGGTFVSGRGQALKQLMGDPEAQLRNPTQTAALGEKDYEQSLPTPDKIQFRYARSVQMLPQEVALYKKTTGQDPPPQVLSRLKGDLDAVEQRDLYQYHYANAHGAKSWKSLPAANKFQGTLSYLQTHHMISPEQLQSFTQASQHVQSETDLNKFVSELWHVGGIGSVANMWKSTIKSMTPHQLQAANK